MTRQQLREFRSLRKEAAGLMDAARRSRGIVPDGVDAYTEAVAPLMSMMAEIEEAVGKLPDPLARAVIRYRYMSGYSWEKIARLISYSRSQTIRIHDAAIKRLEEEG